MVLTHIRMKRRELVDRRGHPSRAGLMMLIVAAAVALSACTATTSGGPRESIGFRQARYAEIAAMLSYRHCRDEGLALDAQARKSGSLGRYLTSAQLLERCEADLGPNLSHIAEEERMRAYAVSIQNYAKAGDINAARARLSALTAAFPGHDLYFADGASFVATMEVLLGIRDRKAVAKFAPLNVNDTVKAELRRAYYWQTN